MQIGAIHYQIAGGTSQCARKTSIENDFARNLVKGKRLGTRGWNRSARPARRAGAARPA